MKGISLLILLVSLLLCNKSYTQSNYKISGEVRDSSGTFIQSASLQLISGTDTLNTISNKDGKFHFSNVTSKTFSLQVTSVGYLAFSKTYQIKTGRESLEIEPIILQLEAHKLNDVVVKSIITPVEFKKDTVEYDARAYIVRDGDMVEDLLKQLPGINVDNDGNVKAEGKGMTKLRVNGKDFFTSDVTTFIKQLPAGIVSKLQVIDDYGDAADFTGIKTGEPQKMLNLVTKPGMNKGFFSNAGVAAGTNEVFRGNATANQWKDTKQTSANINLSTANNNSLTNTSNGASLSFRNNLGKKLVINGDYNYSSNQSKSSTSNYIQSVNPLGTLYSNDNNLWENSSAGHYLNVGLNYNASKFDYLNFRTTVGYRKSSNNNFSQSQQSGVIKQNLQTTNVSEQTAPNFSSGIFFGHRFKKTGRVLSVGINFNGSRNDNEQQLTDSIQYFDQTYGTLVKDSLLRRLVSTNNTSSTVGFNITYSEPLSKNKLLDFSYNYNSSANNNSLLTNISESPQKYHFVDSLSNIYRYSFTNHSVSINYRYTGKKLNYTTGLRILPNSINGTYKGRSDAVNYSTINVSPVANLNYGLSKTSNISFAYSGHSSSPNYLQLQPVADNRNLQDIIVGNPNLKTSFNNNINLSYHQYHTKGPTLMLTLSAGSTKNQVVSNVILIKDSLINSLSQETHFVNANGAYNLNSGYTISQSIIERKCSVDINGRIGYARTISFTDNIKNYSNSMNISQELTTQVNLKKINLNASAEYSYFTNQYSLNAGRTNAVTTWQFNVSNTFYFSKTFSTSLTANKQINSGYYSSFSNNPLLINGYVEKKFFKHQIASLRLQVDDLLNQGNATNRIISNNSIIDSHTNVVTRYILLNFSIRLNRFGNKA